MMGVKTAPCLGRWGTRSHSCFDGDPHTTHSCLPADNLKQATFAIATGDERRVVVCCSVS